MSFKGLVYGGSSLVLSLLAGCSNVANATTADHEVGYFCKDCSYQEAVELAKQKAVPNMSCRISSTPTDDYVETCYSQPKLYYVLNETSRRLNGFIVKHNNQGKMRHELQVVAESRNLSRDHTTLILEALDAKQLLARNLAKAARDFSGVINTGSATGQSRFAIQAADKNMTTAAENDPKAGCSNDPHSLALNDALNPRHKAKLTFDLANFVNDGIASGHYENQADALGKFSFELNGLGLAGGISGRIPNLMISANWGVNEVDSRFVEHTYSSPHDSSISRLRWSATLKGAEIALELIRSNSFIDGMRLDDLMDMNGPKTPKISFCIATVLMDVYNRVNYEQISSTDDLANWGGNYPVIGNDWGGSHGNDQGWICEYSFFNRTGAKIAGFLGRCP